VNKSYEGLLLVNKTFKKPSFSIIAQLRRVLFIKKIGHAGILDPLATGLMVILIGRNFTKKSDKLIMQEKEYEVELCLGYKSDTYDLEGTVTFVNDYKPSIDEVNKALEEFSGDVEQIPPMFSAKKVNGQKLYLLARKGIEIKRKPINVNIKIEKVYYDYPNLRFNAICSKGTYIRSLVNDIGKKLTCGAYLSKLNRTRCGNFLLTDALNQDDIMTLPKNNLLAYIKNEIIL